MSQKMPVLFVGHGNPMNAIENNAFGQAWEKIGQMIPRPKSILSISAHWFVEDSLVHILPKPRLIYDFYGFPPELYAARYDCPGSAELAKETRQTVKQIKINEDRDWGIDHGTWIVLKKMFPEADIPVVQLSLDYTKDARFHYELGRELAPLREQGVLILASGNVVHNLNAIAFEEDAKPFAWAVDFNDQAKKLIAARDHASLIDYENIKNAERAVPTPDHYWPLLCALGLQDKNETADLFVDGISQGQHFHAGV